MNKKQIAIYNKYGIEVKENKLVSPIGLVPEMLVNGNDKIGKGVYHFSTLPGTKTYKVNVNGSEYETVGTCICDCVGCYAMSGNYRYANTINNIGIRNIMARNYMAWLENAIKAQIECYSIGFVRIHASGDFYSVEYAEMWKRIAIAFPNTVCWTYTKNKACESLFDGLNNIG